MSSMVRGSSADAYIDLLMMGVAGIFLALSAVALVPLTLLNLMIITLMVGGQIDEITFPGFWVAIWSLSALFLAYWNMMASLGAIDDPSWRETAKLIVSSSLILVACPVVWITLDVF